MVGLVSLFRNCGHSVRQRVAVPLRSDFRLTFFRSTTSVSAENPEPAEWQSVIGLEIHAQIQSDSKLFSASGTSYGANTNSQVSYFDAALPGTLPVINKRCVEAGVLTAASLGSRINEISLFDRKHYFYADMPAGYQITQQRKPLAIGGKVPYVCQRSGSMERRTATLIQVQLEQDSGKSLHDLDQHLSLVDLNRAGVGLMEIVTAPDFTDGDDAASFVRDLRHILLSVGTCDGKMNEGSLRVDANISVNRPGQELGVRTEVKNLNSIRNLKTAINYEIRRQIDLLNNGGQVINETMTFDAETEVTVPMRDKEKILDYRFMPEPNLPPLVVYQSRDSAQSAGNSGQLSSVVVIDELLDRMGELPDDTRSRLMKSYGISLQDAVLIVRANLSELFEKLVSEHDCPARPASVFVRSHFQTFQDDHRLDSENIPFDLSVLADIVKLYHSKALSSNSVSVLLEEKYKNQQKSLTEIIEEHQLQLMTDMSLIEDLVDEVVSRNPKMVKAYKRGKHNQLEVVYKRIMKKLEHKANGKTVYNLIRKKMEE